MPTNSSELGWCDDEDDEGSFICVSRRTKQQNLYSKRLEEIGDQNFSWKQSYKRNLVLKRLISLTVH